MSFLPAPAPVVDPERALHRRLCAREPLAPLDLIAGYAADVQRFLAGQFPDVHPDERDAAADEALVNLVEHPERFDPNRGTLLNYLRMAARRDLLNALRRERRHHRGRLDWERVAHSAARGKYFGREDDPSFRLRLAETETEAADPARDAVRAELSGPERACFDLMLRGEKRTERFAAALGLTGRPAEEQTRAVKRLKDRLKARVRRAGGTL